jgi:F420H(2)-dependent quinone reductase
MSVGSNPTPSVEMSDDREDKVSGLGVPNIGARVKPPSPTSRAWRVLNLGSRLNVALYRVSGGWLGGRMGRAPVLLLHHVGRKSGKPRVTPVLYLRDGETLVIVASKGGAETNPAWFGNLMAHPSTRVEVGRARRSVVARKASDDERESYWPRLVEMYPSFDVYQQRAERVIPVVVLEPSP